MIADPLQDGSAPAKPQPPPKQTAEDTMRAFQRELLGMTLQRFVEDIEGGPTNDQDLESQSMHISFSFTPLTVFRKGSHQFTQYYVWRGAHAIAHGFLDAKNPTTLTVCRLTRDQWPPALTAYVSQHYSAADQP